MLKQISSIFFITLFFATIIAPSVLAFVDVTIDVSFLIDASEEEEEKVNGKNKELEVFVVEENLESDFFLTKKIEDFLGYSYKKYTKPHLNIIFPPPEFI